MRPCLSCLLLCAGFYGLSTSLWADGGPAQTRRVSRETEMNWTTYCAHCHGRDGRPQTLIELPMPDAPDFSQAEWADYEVDDLTSSITDGTGKMPAFQGLLTKSEMRHLSALVIRFPQGRSGTLVAKRWQYRQRDNELREQP